MTITSLTTRDTRYVVSMLSKGRSTEFAAQASSLPLSTVTAIQEEYGPDVFALRASAERLLHQLDAEAGRSMPRTTAPAQADRAPTAPQRAAAPTSPRPAAPGGFQAGMVPVKNITAHPSNLGRELGDLRDLAASIKKDGIRVPVVLEQHHGRYRLRDGHRRVAAATLAGITKVPAIVHAEALDDREWILEAIDYNLRRQGYTDDDKRRVAHQLTDLGVTHSGIAQAFGISTAKLSALLTDKPDQEPAGARPKRPPTSIGRRTVLTAVQDWRTRQADATTILTELEHLLTPQDVAQ